MTDAPLLGVTHLNPKIPKTPKAPKDPRNWLPIAHALRDIRPAIHSREWQQWIRDVLAVANTLGLVLPLLRQADFTDEVIREEQI